MDTNTSNCKKLKITARLKKFCKKRNQKFLLIKFLKLYVNIVSNHFIIVSNIHFTKRERDVRSNKYRFKCYLFNRRYIIFISLESSIAKSFKKIKKYNYCSVSNPKKIQIHYNNPFLVFKVTKTYKLLNLKNKFTNIQENLTPYNINIIESKNRTIKISSSKKIINKCLQFNDCYHHI